MVENGIKNVRAVSHNLLPATLESFGLVSAIRECMAPIEQSNKEIIVELVVPNDSFRTSKEIELGLLRIFQEFLQNSLKHADASEIRTILTFHPKRIQMDYRDNGKGCNMEEIQSQGIGFKNIQSRVHALNGKIDLTNPNSEGFYASVEIPI